MICLVFHKQNYKINPRGHSGSLGGYAYERLQIRNKL